MSRGADARPWLRLVAAVAAFYREEAARPGPGAPLLAAAAAALETLPPPDMARARRASLPVRDGLHDPADLAEGLLGAVSDAFDAVEDGAEWRRNPGYTERTVGGRFLDGYGYVEPVGPGRLFECAAFRVGLIAIGPRLTYPDHAHPAEEIYHVVAGGAEWRRDGGAWAWRGPGAAIHHPPGIRHATRTGPVLLLALYVWGGEIGPPATLAPA